MKKLISCIAILLVLIACCLPMLLFIGFGYLEYGGKCVYEGPLSSGQGACKDEPTDSNQTPSNDDTKVYETSDYKFSYPSEWSVDESRNGVVSVYPDTGPQGQNLGITNQQFSDDLVINNSYCSNYTSTFTSQLESSGYSNIEVLDSGFVYLNSYPSCLVEFSATVSGRVVYQKQYVFDDPQVDGNTFYLTVTVLSESSLSMFDQVIDSFEIL